MYLPCYQRYIGSLYEEGYQVVGYARKSIGNEDNNTRIRLLQTMVERLMKRSLVNKMFVSPCSSLSERISMRDMKESEIINKLENVHGNTQDMISYITTTENVCLVILDYAGLTTDGTDLRNFVS
ncbi:hypothetical protein BDF14DRAFT_373284 [Spinellus fusiger]|nr:hypothetical protein BDF14DRAFT_373284 [Spinellus fusiger]